MNSFRRCSSLSWHILAIISDFLLWNSTTVMSVIIAINHDCSLSTQVLDESGFFWTPKDSYWLHKYGHYKKVGLLEGSYPFWGKHHAYNHNEFQTILLCNIEIIMGLPADGSPVRGGRTPLLRGSSVHLRRGGILLHVNAPCISFDPPPFCFRVSRLFRCLFQGRGSELLRSTVTASLASPAENSAGIMRFRLMGWVPATLATLFGSTFRFRLMKRGADTKCSLFRCAPATTPNKMHYVNR